MKTEALSYVHYIPIGFFFGIGMTAATTLIGLVESVFTRKK